MIFNHLVILGRRFLEFTVSFGSLSVLGDVREPTLLFEKSMERRSRWCGQP